MNWAAHLYEQASQLLGLQVEGLGENGPVRGLNAFLFIAGRWPDALAAFKKMKAALGVQLAEELFTGFGLRASASEECVDIFTDGFAFRIFLFSERWVHLASMKGQGWLLPVLFSSS